MLINSIRTAILDVPLKRPHKLSLFTIEKVNVILVIMSTDNGFEGLGEAIALGGPTWSEESGESIKSTIDKYLAPYLIGENPGQFEKIRAKMELAVRGNYFAKTALEMALFDVVGKQRGIPVYDLLGGLATDSIPMSWSLASNDAEEELKEAEAFMQKGGFIFKMKVGSLTPEADVARVKHIRESLPGVKLRVDANQGWDRVTAVRTAKQLDNYQLDFIEQPVPRWDINGMAAVAKAINTPVMADESLCTTHDAMELVKNEAASVFGIKLTKAGGFLNCKRQAAIAEAAGIKCYVGCMVETGLGTSAYLHFAVSTPAVTIGCELFGPLLLADDIVKESTQYHGGYIVSNPRPGLGVTLDDAKVNKYIRGKMDTIK